MYAYVKGTLEEMDDGNVVVENGGIGYNIKVPAGVLGRLPGLHHEVKLYTYTSVREDAFWLYGFIEREELELFKQLITVNGLGPKSAQAIFSVMSAQDLRFAIAAGDSKKIATAPGIGKKTAERVIVDLKDKVEYLPDSYIDPSPELPGGAGGANRDAINEATEALVALGYGQMEALKAVNGAASSAGDSIGVEDLIKAALKLLF